MTAPDTTELPVASTGAETLAGKLAQKFSPGLLVLAFLLNALAAMGVVLCFGQLRGVNFHLVVALISAVCVALLVTAPYEILLEASDAASGSDGRRGRLGLFKLLRREWRLLRFKTPTDDGLAPEQRFVAALPFVLLIAGLFGGLCLTGPIWTPRTAPLIDFGVMCLGIGAATLAVRNLGRTTSPEECQQIVGAFDQVAQLAKSPRVRWALPTAAVLATSAYGLVVVLPFASATGCPFAVAFLVFSAVPLSLLGCFIAMLLVPTLSALDTHADSTNSN